MVQLNEGRGHDVTEPGGLDHSLVSGMAWTAVLRWSAQIVSWVGTFYAARILMPGDYGLVSMAMIAIGLARMVEDFGMDAILVQDRGIVGSARARLAGLPLILGLVLCTVFSLVSHPIAVFFDEPKVESMIIALSAVFVTDALQVVPRAQLQRDLQFRRLGIAQLVQVFATQLALITAVSLGLGHWSLVVNTLAGAFAVTLLLCYWSPFAIRWPSDIASLMARCNRAGASSLRAPRGMATATRIRPSSARFWDQTRLAPTRSPRPSAPWHSKRSARSSAGSCPASSPRSRPVSLSCAATSCC